MYNFVYIYEFKHSKCIYTEIFVLDDKKRKKKKKKKNNKKLEKVEQRLCSAVWR